MSAPKPLRGRALARRPLLVGALVTGLAACSSSRPAPGDSAPSAGAGAASAAPAATGATSSSPAPAAATTPTAPATGPRAIRCNPISRNPISHSTRKRYRKH